MVILVFNIYHVWFGVDFKFSGVVSVCVCIYSEWFVYLLCMVMLEVKRLDLFVCLFVCSALFFGYILNHVFIVLLSFCVCSVWYSCVSCIKAVSFLFNIY